MRYAIVTLIAVALAGCSVSGGPSLADQTRDAEELAGPVFYLGDEYAGLPLVAVEAGLDDGNPTGADFVYGDCELEGSDEMCQVPLDVQNAVCPEGTRVVIYATDVDARLAAEHLRPLGGGDAVPYEVRFDHATLCGT